MDNGIIEAQGTPSHMRASGHIEAKPEPELKREEKVVEVEVEEEIEEKDAKDAKKLVDKEKKDSGTVTFKVYMAYVKASGLWIIGLFVVCLFLQRFGDLIQKLWIKSWSESYIVPRSGPEHDSYDNIFGFPPAYEKVMPYVLVYLGIQLANAFISISAQAPTIWSAQRASKKLFTTMLDAVIRSPTRWFDKTPSGRILNRFAKDIDGIDTGLSWQMQWVIVQIIAFFIALGTIAYGIPVFLIVIVFLGYLHWYFANGFIKSSRDLNRIESNLRSPIISAFGELLRGVQTIRSFAAEKRFMQILFGRLDKLQASYYYNGLANQWLRVRFGVLGAVTFFTSTLIVLATNLPAGLAAIVITQAQTIITTIYWGLRAYIDMEQSFNSVERITEYIALEPEPPRIMDKRPPPQWPHSKTGGIDFKDVVIKYAPDLDPVLRGVSFTIKPREKIGLVGRTGSGKSTLALSLFRFVDPEEGHITIDGIDITSIGVEDLRSRLTLIPQDAVLFQGTIRDNLDPFNEYTDAECLQVLRDVQLPIDETPTANASGTSTPLPPRSVTPLPSGAVTPNPEGSKIVVTLESKVSEGGNNWSAGQRQLIAMARALLRQTKIIVLDESTASVDFATDKKIQHTIREGFKDNILITIAHRLHTIIDYDRVLVLDQGKVVEFDTPLRLIQKEDGVFRSMCLKSDSFEALQEIALRHGRPSSL